MSGQHLGPAGILRNLAEAFERLEQERDVWKRRAQELELERDEARALSKRAADLVTHKPTPRIAPAPAAVLDPPPTSLAPKGRKRGERSRKVEPPPTAEIKAKAGDAELERMTQRRRERAATPRVECPHCGAKPNAACVDDETDRKMRGSFHGERYGEARRMIRQYDAGLTFTCPVCKIIPGSPCQLGGGKTGIHDARLKLGQDALAKEGGK